MYEKRKDSKGRVLRNGEVQRDNGQYMFRYVDAEGRRRTLNSWKLVETDKVPKGKHDKESLREMEKKALKDAEDEIRTYDASRITVDDLFKDFLSLRIDLTETTRCCYIGLYEKHIKEHIGSRAVNSIRNTSIQKLYIDLIQCSGIKPSTVEKINAFLRQVFELAVIDGLIRDNPTNRAMKNIRRMFDEEKEQRHALTEEEQEKLFLYIRKTPRFRKWIPLITVLLGTGARIGEVLGLRWCDCDFDKGTIQITHALLYKESEDGGYRYRISSPKTKAGYRIIPMLSQVKTVLEEVRENQKGSRLKPFEVDGYTGFIFLNSHGKVYTPSAVFDVLRDITYSHNKEELFLATEEKREPVYLPKFSAHILRHTFCTRFCENETNLKVIQDIMGHKNISTTMDVYNEATERKKTESFQRLEGKIKLA